MHIAICDDNIADRKQLERLLKRESDKHKDSREPFYIDGYGNPEAVMRTPMLYDAFFIDMTASSQNGYEIAMNLIHIGVAAPIILCISAINYQDYELPGNCFCLKKPIRVSELGDMLEHVFTAYDNKIPPIEIRTEKETYYVTDKDIMYAVTNGRFVDVFLSDGRVLQINDSLANFYEEIKPRTCFLPLSYTAIANVSYIAHTSFFHVRTKNGRKFFLHPNFRKYVHYSVRRTSKAHARGHFAKKF